jgi:hypothetical protein
LMSLSLPQSDHIKRHYYCTLNEKEILPVAIIWLI